jgi:DNA polymerase-4
MPLDLPHPRKIIHLDCDCFFAAVEMRDDPSLRGRPLAVGGQAEHRGVIATCNYEARRYGVRSAMPTREALRRCPNLILRPPDLARYRAASQAVHAILADYTSLIEPLSLDEAYLDVTAATVANQTATQLARVLRERIRAEVGITASAGVAPNKFVAKVASDWRKPDGLFVVPPERVAAFVAALPVARVPGVGPVTANRLRRLGIETCGQLREWPLERLLHTFGRFGATLWERCRGIDPRLVEPDQPRRSLSVETTFARDLPDLAACLAALRALSEDFERRRQRLEALRPAASFVKLRFADFSQTTVESTSVRPTAEGWATLLATGWQRRRQPVRLLGLGIRLAEAPPIACAACRRFGRRRPES